MGTRAMPQTICLNMIVKNEERVLARCLASVRPFIHHWILVDTGSTDGTARVARESLEGIPGAVHERPWRNFGANRTEALDLARGKADYVLLIDADEELVAPSGSRLPELGHDQCMVRCRVDGSDATWYRPTFARSAIPWRYEGVLHEYLTADTPHTTGRVEELLVQSHSDGARNVDPREKYRRDALILEEALKSQPDNARYVFYLAQSYRDAGDSAQSHDVFARRAAMGGWSEEAWYALYQVAVLKEALQRPWPETLAAYLAAFQYRPSRAEPLCDLARHYRGTGEWALAELFARAAFAIPMPSDILFVETSVYAWRAADELAISTYWIGKYQESAAISTKLLASGAAPAQHLERLRKNLEFAEAKLRAT
jgi:glycosyltransferase involved in cell wall biosynthesis